MGRLVGFLQLAGQREHNHIGAVSVSNIILEDESGTPSGLLAASSFKLHHVDFANLRGSVFILHRHCAISFHQRILVFDASIAYTFKNVKLILLFTTNFYDVTIVNFMSLSLLLLSPHTISSTVPRADPSASR